MNKNWFSQLNNKLNDIEIRISEIKKLAENNKRRLKQLKEEIKSKNSNIKLLVEPIDDQIN